MKMNTIEMQRQHLSQKQRKIRQQQGGVREVIRYAIYVTLFALFGIQCKYLFGFCFYFYTNFFFILLFNLKVYRTY